MKDPYNDPEFLKIQSELALKQTKLRLYYSVAWGILSLFLLVGTFTDAREKAIMGMILASVVWVQIEIALRALSSFLLLRSWKQIEAFTRGELPTEEEDEEKEEEE